MISMKKRVSVFAVMATLGVIAAAPAEEGCTKEQGTAIKSAVKDVLSIADAICLSGVANRADLTNAQKLDICAIVDASKQAADAFLVQETKVQADHVAQALAAAKATPCVVVAPVDAGAHR